MANTTWSATDKSASITLTGSNLIATGTAAANVSVRSVDRQITGKFYWEYTFNTVVNIATSAGVEWGVVPLTTPVGQTGAVMYGLAGVLKSGAISIDGSASGSNIGALTAGSVVGVACDFTNRLIWFRLGAAGNWNGSASANPVTGAGGLLTSIGQGIAGNPVACPCAISDQITANFGGSAFTGAVPSGFTNGFTAGASIPTNTLATQSALEQFLTTNPPAQVTQVTIEQWATTATITGQALVTQVALEQWVPAAKPPVELAGNLGGSSHYGKLSYGKAHYSRIDAFAPIFSADVTIAPVVNLAGGLAPIIILAADLDVHVNLIMLRGDLAPQIALGGSLSLDLPLTVLEGGLTPNVVLGASSFVSGPLWADAEPCPASVWAESEPCPPPPWMITPPCDPVVWSQSRTCNG